MNKEMLTRRIISECEIILKYAGHASREQQFEDALVRMEKLLMEYFYPEELPALGVNVSEEIKTADHTR